MAHRGRGLTPPPCTGRGFLACLRVVSGTLECPPQGDPHPYPDLPAGFSKHLQDALFPPWIIGRGSMTVWEARIEGEEWARESGRRRATTRAPGTSAQQYAAVPLEGWGPHTRPRPTIICGAGPYEPVGPGSRGVGHMRGGLGMCPRSSGRPSPPASYSTPPTCSKPPRYTHGGATRPPSVGPPRRRGHPAQCGAFQRRGTYVRRRPVPAGRRSEAPAPHAPRQPCRRATPGAGQLRRAEGRVGGGHGQHPTGPPPPGHRKRVPVGRSCAPPYWAQHVYGPLPPWGNPAQRGMTSSQPSTTTGSSLTTRGRRSGRKRSAGTTDAVSAPAC